MATESPTAEFSPPAQLGTKTREVRIPVRSERQAMDWSLVLASQNMACAIHPPTPDLGWTLEVAGDDVAPALRCLRRYLAENRAWRTPEGTAGPGMLFHPGALLWCLLMILVHWGVGTPESGWMEKGAFVTRATAAGEWWRPVTATFIHGGMDHLAANATSGFLLLGLAIGRFGAGPALLVTLVSGTLGNLTAWALRARDYTGIGSSGVVMAALGMLAFAMLGEARAGIATKPALVRSVLGGSLLFVLLGTSPNADVLAHAGGFVFGGILAALWCFLPVRSSRSRGIDSASAIAYLLLAACCWIRAWLAP